MAHVVVLGAGLGGVIMAYERLALDALGIRKLKEIHVEPAE